MIAFSVGDFILFLRTLNFLRGRIGCGNGVRIKSNMC